MNGLHVAIVLSALAIATAVSSNARSGPGSAPQAPPGVGNPDRAFQNYLLNCQGCHRSDGGGSADTAPALAGQVALFTRLLGGRAYLAHVPGVATAPLSDADLAELLNWTLWRFDRDHIAKDFKPYDAVEIGRLRRTPLRTEAASLRASLLKGLSTGAEPAPDQAAEK